MMFPLPGEISPLWGPHNLPLEGMRNLAAEVTHWAQAPTVSIETGCTDLG